MMLGSSFRCSQLVIYLLSREYMEDNLRKIYIFQAEHNIQNTTTTTTAAAAATTTTRDGSQRKRRMVDHTMVFEMNR
jgi:hypothetical protein